MWDNLPFVAPLLSAGGGALAAYLLVNHAPPVVEAEYCPDCEYDLTGLPATRERCPECGGAIVEHRRIRLVPEPRMLPVPTPARTAVFAVFALAAMFILRMIVLLLIVPTISASLIAGPWLAAALLLARRRAVRAYLARPWRWVVVLLVLPVWAAAEALPGPSGKSMANLAVELIALGAIAAAIWLIILTVAAFMPRERIAVLYLGVMLICAAAIVMHQAVPPMPE